MAMGIPERRVVPNCALAVGFAHFCLPDSVADRYPLYDAGPKSKAFVRLTAPRAKHSVIAASLRGMAMYDLLIKNATVVDGTNTPEVTADVAVKEGRIVAVDNTRGLTGAKREVDAAGALLTPGFVDIHTHYDGQVCWDKEVTPSSWHRCYHSCHG